MNTQHKAMLKLASLIGALLTAQELAPLLDAYFSADEQSILVFGIVFAGGAIYTARHRKQLNAFVRKWPSSLIYTAVILYACKILAEKIINGRTGIEVENIRYASTIGGFIYSIPFSLILISLVMYVLMILGAINSSEEKTDPQEVKSHPLLKICFVGSLLTLGYFIFPRADAFITYTVLADATKISTCGPIEPDVFYVRKNSDACKRIHANPFDGVFEMTDVPSKSG